MMMGVAWICYECWRTKKKREKKDNDVDSWARKMEDGKWKKRMKKK